MKTHFIILSGIVAFILVFCTVFYALTRSSGPCSRFREVSYQDIAPAEATSTAPIFYGIDFDGRFCVLLKDVWVDTSKQ